FVKAKLNIIPILQKIQLYYLSIIKTTIMNDEYQSIILFTKNPQTLVLLYILMELITIIYSDLSKIIIISHTIYLISCNIMFINNELNIIIIYNMNMMIIL